MRLPRRREGSADGLGWRVGGSREGFEMCLCVGLRIKLWRAEVKRAHHACDWLGLEFSRCAG
jgi:hypothetical protein